ncbi:hypothetical protein E2C01_027173 [Portunus trituberculatus]|uniref:Uncharacterized protein n=1 Tax=Portunus trituberculatus TaxID=210409 RepID=A0A5B7EKE9_PORTR|nr:hypothetical protein [Portunus trituberculatus]
MEQLEVMPVSSRVVCLNAPHLKSLCVFEALSRTLGCYYNHHRPQIVSCQGKVRLPVPRITRIRGHTTHTHTPGEAPCLHTLLQMGTYLVFHLPDWTQVQQCHLVLNGIEKVPRTDVPPNIILERIESTTTSRLLTTEGETQTKLSSTDPTTNPSINKSHTKHTTLSSVSERVSCAIRSLGLEHRHTHENNKNTSSKTKQTDPQGKSRDPSGEGQQHQGPARTCLTLNMMDTEEVTTLLDDDEDDYSSDTSDDLHKVHRVTQCVRMKAETYTILSVTPNTAVPHTQVVRRRLLVDITAVLKPPPPDKVLTLLLRPAEEIQAWQFLSSCIKVTQIGSKGLAENGSGTMKKTLTRTKPLYFSKNGNAHRF